MARIQRICLLESILVNLNGRMLKNCYNLNCFSQPNLLKTRKKIEPKFISGILYNVKCGKMGFSDLLCYCQIKQIRLKWFRGKYKIILKNKKKSCHFLNYN